MEMVITSYDSIELTEKEPLQKIEERVWTSNDMNRTLPLINGKSKTAAIEYIRDTESVPRRTATKLLNEMEANKMFGYRKEGRKDIIDRNFSIL